MRILSIILLANCLLWAPSCTAQRLKLSDNQRFLVTEDGEPFFWMADTAWELFHRLTREEASLYLETRSRQGFNVVQAVALAELDGLHTPNRYGATPLYDDDPEEPSEAYFKHVDWIIRRADSLGIYIALLPSWGDKLFTDSWGTGPEIFNPENAYFYGKWIGNRYKDADNIIWILGGDRNPRDGSQDTEVWRQMAAGIADATGGYDKTLMSFHPQPHKAGGSSTWFHGDPWLDFNMHQTGHCPDGASYDHIAHDYSLSPIKPVLDGEPLYEDHPYCFNAKDNGYSLPRDIRRIMYWNVFAGAFGQTYGCHDIWQFYTPDREGVNRPLRPWKVALHLPVASQVKHLKNLMLSRPFLSRIPDPSMVAQKQEKDANFVVATRDEAGKYAMFYFPTGRSTLVDISALGNGELTGWWYDPRSGNSYEATDLEWGRKMEVNPPTSGPGNDWVLVIDRTDANFDVP